MLSSQRPPGPIQVLVIPEIAPACEVAGTVYGPDGQPLALTDVSLSGQNVYLPSGIKVDHITPRKIEVFLSRRQGTEDRE